MLAAGISTGICVLILLVSRSFFHGPMMLLANFVALPVNVRCFCVPDLQAICCGESDVIHLASGVLALQPASHCCSERILHLMNVNLCLQVALILPFMRLGEVILQERQLPLSPISLKDIIFNHPGALPSITSISSGQCSSGMLTRSIVNVSCKSAHTLPPCSCYKGKWRYQRLIWIPAYLPQVMRSGGLGMRFWDGRSLCLSSWQG